MAQAMINIEERSNRVLNIIKAKYGLQNKSQAIDLVVSKYEEDFLEPEMRPEFVEQVLKSTTGKTKHFASVKDFEDYFGM